MDPMGSDVPHVRLVDLRTKSQLVKQGKWTNSAQGAPPTPTTAATTVMAIY